MIVDTTQAVTERLIEEREKLKIMRTAIIFYRDMGWELPPSAETWEIAIALAAGEEKW